MYYIKDANNNFIPATDEQICETARNIYKTKLAKRKTINNRISAAFFCRGWIGAEERENFGVIFMDRQHRVLAKEVLFQGTIDAASVYGREVVKAALRCNAAAVMFTHNHPSSDVHPSHADKQITEKLKQALELISVHVVDHIIVNPHDHYSFAANGLL
jgi:DNA repair protein RadC